MKRSLLTLLTVLLVLSPVKAFAEPHTLSWDAVTTYTDLTAITVPVTYDAMYSSSSTFVTPYTYLLSNGSATSVTFDPTVLNMTRGSVYYFTALARAGTDISALAPSYAWTVPLAVLTGLSINGSSTVAENSTATYTATATWDVTGSTTVTPVWSVSSSTYASISASGVLTTLSVNGEQTVTITASYTSGSITETASKVVTISDSAKPKAPVSLRIL